MVIIYNQHAWMEVISAVISVWLHTGRDIFLFSCKSVSYLLHHIYFSFFLTCRPHFLNVTFRVDNLRQMCVWKLFILMWSPGWQLSVVYVYVSVSSFKCFFFYLFQYVRGGILLPWRYSNLFRYVKKYFTLCVKYSV